MGNFTLGMKEHMGACCRVVFSLQSDMFKYICNLGMCVRMHAHVMLACVHAYMGVCVCVCVCGDE